MGSSHISRRLASQQDRWRRERCVCGHLGTRHNGIAPFDCRVLNCDCARHTPPADTTGEAE